MKKTVVAVLAGLALGAAGAHAQGIGSVGAAPPSVPSGEGLRDQGGTGLTAGPSTALGRNATGAAAGAYNKDDLGVNQAAAPVERRDPDRDIGGHGRALDSTVLGAGGGDGLIAGSGAQIH